MSFSDFDLRRAVDTFGLQEDRDCDLFATVEPLIPSEFVRVWLDEFAPVALGINSEMARSTFIIAPVLLELRRMAGDRLGLFSGVPLQGDPERGLTGVCDFLPTTSGLQLVVSAPLVAVVEAKNDNLLSGLGQCIAATVAARLVNEREGAFGRVVYGTVTTGSAWKFLKLAGVELTIDRREYSIENVAKVLGIFQAILQNA